MDYREIVMTRFACRRFDGRVVPEEKISELLELVRFSPSAINLQPWRIKVVFDQKIKDQLVPASFSQSQVANCSHLLVFCADRRVDELIDKLDGKLIDVNVPEAMRTTMIGLARGMSQSMSSEKKLEWSQCQVYLAAANAFFAAKAIGLDSCPMTGFNPAEYSRILNLPEPLVPTILCPVGYAAEKPLPKIRFDLKDILI